MTEGEATKAATMLLSINQSGGISANTVHANTINVHTTPAHDPALPRRALLEGARKLHETRARVIAVNDGMVSVLDGGILLMHLVPLEPSTSTEAALFESISRHPRLFTPIGGNLLDFRIVFDGLLTGSNAEGLDKPQRAYVHVSRSGVVEAVVSSLSRGQKGECVILPYVQAIIINYCREYAISLRECGLEPPLVVLVSLLKAKGQRLVQDFLSRALSVDVPGNYLASDFVYFGAEILDHIPVDDNDSAGQIEPILTHLANASGLGSSPYFDSVGRYTLKIKI